MNLSLTPKRAQRCCFADFKTNASPFALLARTRSGRPLRLPRPAISARPLMRGDRKYLRALRAAEMAAWEAGMKFAPVLRAA